jgi:hypothetical protein
VKAWRKAAQNLSFALAFKQAIGLGPMLGSEMARNHEGVFLQQFRVGFECDQPFSEFFREGVTILETLEPV